MAANSIKRVVMKVARQVGPPVAEADQADIDHMVLPLGIIEGIIDFTMKSMKGMF